MEPKTIFAKLDGTPAHILIIVGLALTLFVPLIPRYRDAAVDSAKTRFDQAGQMIQLDLGKFNRDQDAERRKMSADTSLSYEDRTKKEQALKDAADQKKEELDKKYDTDMLKRDLLNAEEAAAGTSIHFLISWLGRLALLLGLLTLTIQSEGTRQKIILIILLVVMFSSLSGVNFDFATLGHFGESPSDITRQLRNR